MRESGEQRKALLELTQKRVHFIVIKAICTCLKILKQIMYLLSKSKAEISRLPVSLLCPEDS